MVEPQWYSTVQYPYMCRFYEMYTSGEGVYIPEGEVESLVLSSLSIGLSI